MSVVPTRGLTNVCSNARSELVGRVWRGEVELNDAKTELNEMNTSLLLTNKPRRSTTINWWYALVLVLVFGLYGIGIVLVITSQWRDLVQIARFSVKRCLVVFWLGPHHIARAGSPKLANKKDEYHLF